MYMYIHSRNFKIVISWKREMNIFFSVPTFLEMQNYPSCAKRRIVLLSSDTTFILYTWTSAPHLRNSSWRLVHSHKHVIRDSGQVFLVAFDLFTEIQTNLINGKLFYRQDLTGKQPRATPRIMNDHAYVQQPRTASIYLHTCNTHIHERNTKKSIWHMNASILHSSMEY